MASCITSGHLHSHLRVKWLSTFAIPVVGVYAISYMEYGFRRMLFSLSFHVCSVSRSYAHGARAHSPHIIKRNDPFAIVLSIRVDAHPIDEATHIRAVSYPPMQ